MQIRSRIRALRFALSLWAVSMLLPGCSDEYYATTRAFLKFTPVTAVHPLYTALNNPGMFCRVTIGTTHFHFSDAEGQNATYPLTALAAYGRPECLAGFVIGTPSLPDLNMGQQPVTYDLVCPTCYQHDLIQRSLDFSAREKLSCPHCQSVYDLTTGTLHSGKSDAVRLLYRYKITYSPANDLVLVIN